MTTARPGLRMVALILPLLAAAASAQQPWRTTVEIDATGLKTEGQFLAALKQNNLDASEYVNYFTGRWPSISFIGGMAMGNASEDLEFFYEQPFRYHNEVLDWVMDSGGTVYGIRARFRRYKEGQNPKPLRSFLLTVRCDVLMADHHPSYILVNGRRVWDSTKHPCQGGRILVPFSLEAAVDPVIDFVVDQRHTPRIKGLAFRMFFLNYLGEPGARVDLKNASVVPEPSPADRLERFAFGLFPSTFEFWANRGPTFAQIRQAWKPNFRPAYPVDDVYLSPFVFDSAASGKYHDFMVTYGGCNVLGNKPDQSWAKSHPHLRAALASANDPRATNAILKLGLEPHWFGGEEGVGAPDSVRDHAQRMAAAKEALETRKQAFAQPRRIRSIHEPFPPSLTTAHEYERGHDILVLKNEEDPQYNIMMSMARGAGRSFNRPFGFYWEQTHYPYPSLDFKLHACLLYYLCGGSWIGAEAENFPAFESQVVPEPVLPFVQAMRFAMIHPARGKPIVPIGILWTAGDRWPAPYQPLGSMDTFLRFLRYDHATRTLASDSYAVPQPWFPADRSRWGFENSGHARYYLDHVQELRGYDLLDLFFPQFGDAFTARITRLLTGTPFGPVDFVYGNQATAEHLKSFGLLAMLGHANLTADLEQKLTAAVESGATLVLGAQHLKSDWQTWSRPWGLQILPNDLARVEGPITGQSDFYANHSARFSGNLYACRSVGWQTIASVDKQPLVLRKSLGKGVIYLYLGQWIADGATSLRPILSDTARAAAPLQFTLGNDQLEYVAYRKGAGAWLALFNHGNIAIGCDRLKQPRATPPEPLVSRPQGPYRGRITFNLARLGLDPRSAYSLYEVVGIDRGAFDRVISGNTPFSLRELNAAVEETGGLISTVSFDARAEYLIAPRGQGETVFFGPP